MELGDRKRDLAVWLTWLFAVVAYLLPWIITPSAALTLNGYDLAEWTRLHPALQSTFDPLVIALLLRLPLVCLSGIAVCIIPHKQWWLTLGVVAAFAIALQPPIEFYSSFRDDPNYQQLATLSMLLVIVGLLIFILRKFQPSIIVILAIVSTSALLIAIWQSLMLALNSIPNSTIGIGAVLSTVCMILLCSFRGMGLLKTNRVDHHYPAR
jgi:hypothetical protein